MVHGLVVEDGGVLWQQSISVASGTTYSIVIGNGGAVQNNGQNSTAFGYTAIGGGRGGGTTSAGSGNVNWNGASGGSGGGGSRDRVGFNVEVDLVLLVKVIMVLMVLIQVKPILGTRWWRQWCNCWQH